MYWQELPGKIIEVIIFLQPGRGYPDDDILNNLSSAATAVNVKGSNPEIEILCCLFIYVLITFGKIVICLLLRDVLMLLRNLHRIINMVSSLPGLSPGGFHRKILCVCRMDDEINCAPVPEKADSKHW